MEPSRSDKLISSKDAEALQKRNKQKTLKRQVFQEVSSVLVTRENYRCLCLVFNMAAVYFLLVTRPLGTHGFIFQP